MADKTIVQVPVTKAHLGNITVVNDAGIKTFNVVYTPRDTTGALIGQARSFAGSLTQDPDLWAWVDNVVLPAINTNEGTA